MIVGGVIGAVAYVISATIFVFYEKLPLDRLFSLMFLLVLPALVLCLAVTPTLMFSIHVVDGWVEHRFLDRWVLSRALASDFIAMETPCGFFAAKLMFADGKNIRFFGAHLGILSSLHSELQRRESQKK